MIFCNIVLKLQSFDNKILCHIIGRYVMTDISMHFMSVVCYNVIKVSLIYIIIRISSYKYQHLHQIAYFCSVWASR